MAVMARRTIARAFVFVCLAGVATIAVGLQSAGQACAEYKAGGKLPQFEVATIRPFQPPGVAGLFTYPGGRVEAGHLNLRTLLMFACNVQAVQIVGGPAWVATDYFNLEAKPPASSSSTSSNPPNRNFPPNDEQRQMLLALLLDRFQLKFHVEARDGPVYLLERGKGALKLDPPKDLDSAPRVGPDAGNNATMPLLAASLSGFLQRPVFDRTGIQGAYDFKYQADGASPNSMEDFVSSLITSVQGLGLNLVSAKGPVLTVVIDHVEPPSPN